MPSIKDGHLKTAIIIGAGPAGLTAAYELIKRSDIKPIIFELSDSLGGLSRTVNYKGNRIDIGGHRFFSKSDRIMQWWQQILPLQQLNSQEPSITINYQNKSTQIICPTDGPDPEKTDKVLLIRNRLSRIYFEGKFFDYPDTFNLRTIKNLGILRTLKIGLSYLRARVFPIKKEKSLEDFFINRFGVELYKTFFKDYTEKVWGLKCTEIGPEWGEQRVKGLSILKLIVHLGKNILPRTSTIEQKDVETSLIQRFLYPKFGPGQMWEEVAAIIRSKGPSIHMLHQIVGLNLCRGLITEVKVKDLTTGEIKTQAGDYFISSMPIKELIEGLQPDVPADVSAIAQGLLYRDFITVGLLVKKLNFSTETRDNWIYIQEKGVRIGRLQVFNNWSPYLVKDPQTIWLGLEYFCNEGDDLWNKSDDDFLQFAINELVQIKIITKDSVLDGTVLRMPKAYPVYTGTYNAFDTIKRFTDSIYNLFLIGRNGMHKYNNQDHSMLTAMTAVDNIIRNVHTKDNIWSINTEQEYYESSGSTKSVV